MDLRNDELVEMECENSVEKFMNIAQCKRKASVAKRVLFLNRYFIIFEKFFMVVEVKDGRNK